MKATTPGRLVRFLLVLLSALIIPWLATEACFAQTKANPPKAHAGTSVARFMAGGQVHLAWDIPDPGGAPTHHYEVYRTTFPVPAPPQLAGGAYYLV